ncbi:carbohydrate porin [Niveibacterium sp. SC-1]|uniref:carbohydrate porin n=1 Tax=Niveibacterium sp. SC-1 TaxID=3135646 RepID=UPI00311EF0A4
MAAFRTKTLACAIAALAAAPLHAAAPSQQDLLRLIEKLNARVERLEQRNAELESQQKTPAREAALDKRVQELEAQQRSIAKGLDSDNISENEPDLTARLKAVESETLEMKKAAKKVDALDGLKIGASLVTVAQSAAHLPPGTADGESQLNYRGDVTIEMPLEPMGNVEHKVFAHFRMGQGQGLNAAFSRLGGFASAPNSTAFRASGAPDDDSVVILGEAWYQAAIPLPYDGFRPYSRETLELTFGKMDIFGFFDQNAVAGDESRQFLNSVFVHNPLLDAGGEVGVDANGFQPGFVASYLNSRSKPDSWKLTAGVFGTGEGANYSRVFTAPLTMVQAELSTNLFDGLRGSYRAYVWHSGQGVQLDDSSAHHTGWGVSVDQRVSDELFLFGRYGQLARGELKFDRALTLGGELNGSWWSRGDDALGLGWAWLRSSKAYRNQGGSADIDGDGNADQSFTPSGAEQLVELYYRYHVNGQFSLSPDVQVVRRMGANPDASTAAVYGVRAALAF